MAESSKQTLTISNVNLVQKYTPWLYSFWKFSRPHTIFGTTFSVWGLTFVAWSDKINATWQDGDFVATALTAILVSWLACLCGNVYIVGLNQLEDVEIDRINKPHLPLASGEYSPSQAKAIIITTGILALILATLQGKFLLATVGISLAMGTAYSLPPIRLKRFPFWAALCIFTVRGVIVNLGIYLHLSWVFSGKLPEYIPSLTPSILALTLFILVFTFAIAIFKDIPDLEGDRKYNISTFTIRLGTVSVFKLARWVLTGCYLGMIFSAFFLQAWLNPIFLVSSHVVILALLWWRSTKINLEKKESIADFYQFIWKLFFLEYLLFPLACLLG
ncbi:homogentisate phytyltransferase [Limnoraphis robusta]|uniref:Homogentisate phytyltransferase n=1 Tax=Limnoraphis robusta CCNP1315 TaxID=3110306 RepID=A0ABU5TVQ2_9CYAN|nr:homogentisate phytyltransferase [Limnoraphis robusta]MEA5498972.1 homogentisate phytyltransferase [Limnoraphis robusta BA-68 BA1]MEA5518979.1 homogentisate phytyltransferase [Limnoraphis robusta CCNP1315]MEA5544049.1 homogentisate phytyltransferase [Limnoraphis robusta CCNP1324]